MIHVIKILLFLGVNTAGFNSAPVTYVLLSKYYLMPDIKPEHAEIAGNLFLAGGVIVYCVMALLSVGYFFAPREWRTWLLMAPLFVPALYTLGLTAYFHFV